MKHHALIILSKVQMLIVYLTYYCSYFCKREYMWVLGVDEMANNLFYLSNILEPSATVSLSKNRYYQHKYTYSLNIKNRYIRFAIRLVYGPILLGYLANKSSHFCYIWSTGFLCDRESEFRFLKRRGKKVICIFIGDDIRSPKRMKEEFDDKGIVSCIEYICNTEPSRLSSAYENEKEYIAKTADKYADLIFNYKCDQASYLKSEVYPFPYIVTDCYFNYSKEKFAELDCPRIVHAPTNPGAKGTQLVRAAIKKLSLEGYQFKYIELQGVDNAVVLDTLRDAHIALNEFYAFVPGLFGVEAMANHCAVLMSADSSIETTLPEDSDGAWVVTKYWELYDNLKLLLDKPDILRNYADRGFLFAKRHYTSDTAKAYYLKLLKEKKIM